jgi:hypothetical protein
LKINLSNVGKTEIGIFFGFNGMSQTTLKAFIMQTSFCSDANMN